METSVEERMAGQTYPLHVVPKSRPMTSRARSSITVISDIRLSRGISFKWDILLEIEIQLQKKSQGKIW